MSPAIETDPPWPDSRSTVLTKRGNRRRLLVFAGVFALVMLIGQAWNHLRPDVFRTSTRLQIGLADATGATETASASTYASRLQLVNSRPVLTRLADRLRQAGANLPPASEQAVTSLQAMLDVQPMPGSEVIQVQATGQDPRLLTEALNVLPDVVREELQGRQSNDADERLTRARQELTRLDTKAQDRRARLDQFRQRAGVVAERDDNEAVSINKGLANALNNAIEKETAASARMRAMTEAAAEGRMSTQGRQSSTLASLEGKAHQIREDIREMERSFTPAFMEMDPKTRAMRVRLTELERQIVQQREQGQVAALEAAREDLAGAQAQVARLREKQSAARPALGKVSTRLSEAKVLEDDLAQIEKARRELLERVARLESNDQRRVVQMNVVEAAVLPSVPFLPDRFADGVWVLGGALLAAALAMALVEVFNRQAPLTTVVPTNTTLVLSPGWHGGPALTAGQAAQRLPLAQPPGPDGERAALGMSLEVLQQPEAAALLAATRGTARLACAVGLLGLTPAEAIALRWADLQPSTASLQVRGAWSRAVPLPDWLSIKAPERADDEPLLADAAGQPLDQADLQAMLASAALDAGLPNGASLSWDLLRTTCIDWLLSQGLKFSELPPLVGRVDTNLLAALSRRQVETPRRTAEEIDALMPALRIDPAG
jgi:succinoglycan biosynthesis transport protein ExoP